MLLDSQTVAMLSILSKDRLPEAKKYDTDLNRHSSLSDGGILVD